MAQAKNKLIMAFEIAVIAIPITVQFGLFLPFSLFILDIRDTLFWVALGGVFGLIGLWGVVLSPKKCVTQSKDSRFFLLGFLLTGCTVAIYWFYINLVTGHEVKDWPLSTVFIFLALIIGIKYVYILLIGAPKQNS